MPEYSHILFRGVQMVKFQPRSHLNPTVPNGDQYVEYLNFYFECRKKKKLRYLAVNLELQWYKLQIAVQERKNKTVKIAYEIMLLRSRP